VCVKKKKRGELEHKEKRKVRLSYNEGQKGKKKISSLLHVISMKRFYFAF